MAQLRTSWVGLRTEPSPPPGPALQLRVSSVQLRGPAVVRQLRVSSVQLSAPGTPLQLRVSAVKLTLGSPSAPAAYYRAAGQWRPMQHYIRVSGQWVLVVDR